MWYIIIQKYSMHIIFNVYIKYMYEIYFDYCDISIYLF